MVQKPWLRMLDYDSVLNRQDREIAALSARMAELELENERLRQDRLDYSRVTTTEGMNASEWIWRTGKAERRVAALEAELKRERALKKEVQP